MVSEASRQDVQAALGARRELGGEYEDAVLDSFLERMDSSIAARVDSRVADRLASGSAPLREQKDSSGAGGRSFVLGIVSLGTGIPITAIAGTQSGVGGLIVAWAGIAAVNVAHALAGRRR